MKTAYKLYASNISADSLNTVMSSQHGRVTSDYVLLYSKDEKPDKFIEIDGDNLQRLSVGDMAWLNECNLEILQEELSKRDDGVRNNVFEKLGAFEEELKRIKEGTDES